MEKKCVSGKMAPTSTCLVGLMHILIHLHELPVHACKHELLKCFETIVVLQCVVNHSYCGGGQGLCMVVYGRKSPAKDRKVSGPSRNDDHNGEGEDEQRHNVGSTNYIMSRTLAAYHSI